MNIQGLGRLGLAVACFVAFWACGKKGSTHAEDAGTDAGDTDAGDATPLATFEAIGPSGGYISSFAFHPSDPDTVYAGADDSGGLWVSRDRGSSWDPVDIGAQNFAAWDVAVSRTNPDFMAIADCYGHGVRVSSDGGQTWEERNSGLAQQDSHRRVRALVIDPTDHNVLYAGTAVGVYKSVDGAGSWQPASGGLGQDIQVFRLAIDRTDTQRLYAGVDGGEIWRTLDGGQNWSAVTDLMPTVDEVEFWDLSIAPSDSNRVVGACGDIVVLSRDGGDTWNDITPTMFDTLGGIPLAITAAFSPTDAQTIYLGTFRLNGKNLRVVSRDGGTTFQNLGESLEREAVFRIRPSPNDPNFLLTAFIGDGMERSVDGGQTWTRHQGWPMVATAPGAIATAPSQPERFYLAGSPTFYRSSDGGETWTDMDAPESISWSMAVHPDRPNVVYLAPLFTVTEGMYLSEDNGMTWLPVGPTGIGVTCLKTDPDDEEALYACGFSFAGGPFGVYKSTNWGRDFTRLTPDTWFNTIAPMGLALHPTEVGALLVATSEGLYASDSAQTQFQQVALAGTLLFDVDASDSGLWVAGGENGFHISLDSGQTWEEHPLPDTDATNVLLDPDRPERILVAATAVDIKFGPGSVPGLYLSDDAGQTFVELTEALLPSDQVQCLELDPTAADSYLIGIYSGAGGFFRVYIP